MENFIPGSKYNVPSCDVTKDQINLFQDGEVISRSLANQAVPNSCCNPKWDGNKLNAECDYWYGPTN